MRKTIIAVALGATLLAGGAALAGQEMPAPPPGAPQDGPPPMRDPLERLDTNHDGIVTRDELLADVEARFAKVDTNHDGKITPEERKAAFEAMASRRGAGGFGMRMGGGMRADANGDGSVTLDEQKAQALKRFSFIDRNGDGKVDQAERDQMREMMMEMHGPGGHHGPPPSPGDGPPPPPPADSPAGPGGQ